MHEVKDDEPKLVGIRQAAVKETKYKLADGTYVGNVLKETTMNEQERKELVDQLIANKESPYTEDDRKVLLALGDTHLQWVANVKETAEDPEGEGKPEDGKTDTKPEDGKTEETPTGNAEPTVEEYIDKAPEGMRDMLRQGIASHAAEKDGLVKKITANTRNPFTKEQLEAKDMSELKSIAILAEVPAPASAPPPPHFSGQAPVTAAGAQEEPLVAPTMNFDPETKTE